MASSASCTLLLPTLSLAVILLALCARGGEARPPPPLHGVRPLAFDEGYTQIFGSANLALLRDGRRVRLTLDESTGAGFASQDVFLHGFFSAAIKLPADYAAGVVVAFYLSNGDVYEKTHDELDFEFLGNVRGREWRVQTNVYGNGSTDAGREERYDLPFDPTDDFHHYSILWTSDRIIFYVDETPIREVVRTAAMGAAFPSKPMSLYATIWDGSAWATLGGRYRVNYKYAPFVAEFADLAIQGCAVDPAADHAVASCGAGLGLAPLAVSAEQRSAMAAFRRAHTSYSYCHDRRRYPVALSECGAGAGLLPGRMFGPDGMKQHRRHRGAARGHRGGAQDDDVM
ncbi:putative xyloglucan endotransglucosylase/hydrolase protein 28 [Zea mays]|uniref:Xyloglucan endotransglucosylase/hydrolase n=2 Tax=Zea mays TaxID=4577 RepID=A0A096T7G6_MAIZE|nr:probable xyloglucan endotransglucosylase/hydrolase protein 28 [Zea mays]ONM54845.1 putative xyloglucan endotransglucosylase/hydrolase protein 28 [Zea mays]PWZ14176.1 putative xyloglucan endotransglucosylase/hydrolase protein 28 [Zea mays]|eukprot:XP_008652681.1 probable xyloglucan endotransglucosylase/hydrolase protein 28 [Zea mays]